MTAPPAELSAYPVPDTASPTQDGVGHINTHARQADALLVYARHGSEQNLFSGRNVSLLAPVAHVRPVTRDHPTQIKPQPG